MALQFMQGYQKDTSRFPESDDDAYNPPPIVDTNWDQGAPSAPAANAALAGELPDSTPVVPVGRDAQADPEPPAVDPTVLAGLRNESTPAEPAADAGFSPELKRIKDAHDAHLLAKHLPADVPYAGEMAPDNPNTPTVVYAHGRPDSVYGGDEAANQAALAKAVRDYKPQKAKGFVNRYLKPIAMGALAGGRTGSPFGMIGGAISGGITGAVKPELANERWKAGKQAEIVDQQVAATKEAQAQAQIAHTRAETRKLNSPAAKKTRIVKDKQGVFRPIDAETGKDENGNLVQGEVQGATGGFTGWANDADGIAHYYQKGQMSAQLDPGRNKLKLPDGRLVDPSQTYSAELTSGRQTQVDEQGNEANRQENAQFEASIKQLTYERDGLDAALKATDSNGNLLIPKMIDRTDTGGKAYKSINPEYQDYMERRRQANDKILGLQDRIHPIVTPRPAYKPPTGGPKYKVDPKFLQ